MAMKRRYFDAAMRILKRRYRAPAASAKETPWDVLLFTLLSARTRDEQTEIAFRKLRRAYPTVSSLASAEKARVERILQTIGLYRNKSKQVIALARTLEKKYEGAVPKVFSDLVALPGVGRKTASCVMVYAYGKPAIAVDTHVHRVAGRLGWAREKTPEKTELVLRKILPNRHWLDINRVMVQFGRDICRPGVPLCWKCPVRRYCAYPRKTPKPKHV